MNAETPKLKLSEKLGFGTFSTASNIVYNFKSLYYLFFLTNVLGIPIAVAGIIRSLGIVWDAVNDPLVGYYAVNHRFKSGERVRPFALWSALPWAITVVLIFTNFRVSQPVTIAIAAIAFFLFELLNTMVGIPYNSMGGLATNRDSDRRSINVFRNIGGCVGTAIGAVACLPLLKLFGALDGSGNLAADENAVSRGFILAAGVMGAICIIGALTHYFTTRERVEPIRKEEKRLSLFETFRILYGYKPFVMNTLYILLYGIINMLLMTCITYYATYVFGRTSAATPVQAVYLVASLATSVFVGKIDNKLGRKKTMLLGGVCYVLGKIWFILDPFSMGAIYVNCLFTGIAVAITFVMFNTNRNNLTDLIEWREGRRVDGMVGTADNLSTKMGEAVASLLLTSALAAAGFSAELAVQSDTAVRAICAMLGWVPAVLGLVLIVVVLFLNIDIEMESMRAGKASGAQKES